MNKHTFVETCGACPEQYDVFDENGVKIGYVRLRHGSLSTEGAGGFARTFPMPDDLSQIPDLDERERHLPYHESDGIFTDDVVRDTYLTIISERIAGNHRRREVEDSFLGEYTITEVR